MSAGLVRQVSVHEVRPAAMNCEIYRRPGLADNLADLVASIKENGVMTPLTLTADLTILSGHRRHAASVRAGLKTVPCIVRKNIVSTSPNFPALLVAANTQREKTLAEIAAELTVRKSKDKAIAELTAARIKKLKKTETACLSVDLGANRRRISAVKEEMAEAVIITLEALENFWPVTLRQLHYRLLNDPPLRNSRDAGSRYQNDRKSYQDLSDLVTRLRVEGRIGQNVISDPTRETYTVHACQNAGEFIRRERDGIMRGYWRDLQQGQPLHLEIIAEKNTVLATLEPLAARYTVPLTILRGYPSYTTLEQLARRIMRAEDRGKQKTRLIAVSDHDPEGEDICRAVERVLTRDLGINFDRVETVKAALTMEQIKSHKLPPGQSIKKTSSRAFGYMCKHGQVLSWELEALHPQQLQNIVGAAVEQSMDADAFNAELEKEKEEAVELDAVRQQMLAAMGGHASVHMDRTANDNDLGRPGSVNIARPSNDKDLGRVSMGGQP